MKKIIINILCMFLMISMFGCQSSPKQQEQTQQPVVENKTEEKKTTEKKEKQEKKEETTKQTQTTKENETPKKQTQKNKSEEKTKKEEKTEVQKKKEESTKPKVEKEYCTMVISCKSVLNHKDKLESNYQVPSNGIIYSQKIEIKSGDDVLKILKRTGIRIDVQSGYVRGIDNLYEFDCGQNSGWLYKVNGVRPNVGASKYKVKKNDRIEWLYTCQMGDV